MNVQYCFKLYEKFHQNKTNKIIHVVCIPMITWTFLILLNNISFYISFLISNFYVVAYSFIEMEHTIPIFLIFNIGWLTAFLFYDSVNNANYFAIALNLLSWLFQFIGHTVFEKNRPALMDSIGHAFFIAPLFSYMELINLTNIY